MKRSRWDDFCETTGILLGIIALSFPIWAPVLIIGWLAWCVGQWILRH